MQYLCWCAVLVDLTGENFRQYPFSFVLSPPSHTSHHTRWQKRISTAVANLSADTGFANHSLRFNVLLDNIYWFFIRHCGHVYAQKKTLRQFAGSPFVAFANFRPSITRLDDRQIVEFAHLYKKKALLCGQTQKEPLCTYFSVNILEGKPVAAETPDCRISNKLEEEEEEEDWKQSNFSFLFPPLPSPKTFGYPSSSLSLSLSLFSARLH